MSYQVQEVAAGGDTAAALNVDGTPVQAPGFYVEVTVPPSARNATIEVLRSAPSPVPDGLRFNLGGCGWVDVPMPAPGASAPVAVPLCAGPQAGEQHLDYNMNGGARFTFRLLAEAPAEPA